MRRRWTSFDSVTTDAEFGRIPQPDIGALFTAMGRYGEGLEGGFTLKNYGEGLLMIKATNGTSGRCLFFTIDETDHTLLVALLGYKKESDEAPANLIQTARTRRAHYFESRRKDYDR